MDWLNRLPRLCIFAGLAIIVVTFVHAAAQMEVLRLWYNQVAQQEKESREFSLAYAHQQVAAKKKFIDAYLRFGYAVGSVGDFNVQVARVCKGGLIGSLLVLLGVCVSFQKGRDAVVRAEVLHMTESVGLRRSMLGCAGMFLCFVFLLEVDCRKRSVDLDRCHRRMTDSYVCIDNDVVCSFLNGGLLMSEDLRAICTQLTEDRRLRFKAERKLKYNHGGACPWCSEKTKVYSRDSGENLKGQGSGL